MIFNKKQQEIIQSLNGAYIVSAPVGTGKTTVLTERVVHAIEAGIKPDEILCLTFTNKAAEEMVSRIKERLDEKELSDEITVKTFHGFCVYFIRSEAKRIGVNSNFVIFDEEEQIEIMNKILEKHPSIIIEEEQRKKQVMGLIEKLYEYRLHELMKNIGCAVGSKKISAELKNVNDDYLAELKNQNAFDFNQLVILTLQSLYGDEALRSKWLERYKLIQVDEFQDTHLSEYLVVKELAKKHGNVAFIGDLDQTIYGWRGSKPFLIKGLVEEHFKPVKEIKLELNYRFNKNILGAVKSFLKSLTNASTQKIETLNPDDESKECVQVFGGYNFAEEASWVIESVKNIRDKEPGAKIAVLTRANYLIGQLAGIFSEKNIAHVTVDKYDFFRRQEVKDIYAYLKIIYNKFDLESAQRITSRPARNIGKAALDEIRREGELIGLLVSDFLNLKNYNYREPFANLISAWSGGRIIVLDTETTGTNVLKDEVIQIYAIEVVGGKPGRDFHFYLKNRIPVGVSEAVHGISDDFLREKGRDPKEVLAELKEFIGDDMVAGHNVNFDLNMLEENCKRHGLDVVFKEYYDTLSLSRRLVESDNYRLGTLAKKFGLEAATHDARDDVMATVGLLGVLTDKLAPGSAKREMVFKKHLKKFVKLGTQISAWQIKARRLRPADLLEYVWSDSGLKEYYEKEKDSAKRLKSIETLKSVFNEKDDPDKPADISLRELIHFAGLSKDINFLGLEQGKIPIVTIHQVKGLEFDYVFIAGMNEYRFPIQKSDLEEEKRLFYVALTRAKKGIYLSYSRFNDYGRNLTKSRFVDYIDKEYVRFM